MDGKGIEGAARLVLAVLEAVGLIAHQEVTAVRVLGEALDVGPQALVAAYENLKELSLGEAVEVVLNALAVGLRQRQGLDSAGSQPFDELVFPVLDQRTRAHYNDALGRGLSVGCDSCLEKCVDQGH